MPATMPPAVMVAMPPAAGADAADAAPPTMSVSDRADALAAPSAAGQDVPPPAVPGGQVMPPPVVPTLPAPSLVAEEEGGDIVVSGRNSRGDPLEGVNETTFAATQAVDDALIAPAARAYKKVPTGFRVGLRNVLLNLREPVVAANFLLQLKLGKAVETVGRFAVNTTVGLVGVLDVARKRPFNLPRRRNGFANTLGFYGVRPGPFFFLPLLGATTLRDLFGTIADQAVPLGPIRPFAGGAAYAVPIGVLSSLDYRIELDEELVKARNSGDPYAAMRSFYLRRRQAEIDSLKGRKTDGPRPVLPAKLPGE